MMVDLSRPACDEIEDDRPASVRDALVFLELACFTTAESVYVESGQDWLKMILLSMFLWCYQNA